MKIHQWLFRVLQHSRATTASSPGSCKRVCYEEAEEEAKSKDLVINQGGVYRRSHEEFRCREGEGDRKNTLTFLLRRDDSRSFFYKTLQIKQLRDIYRNQHFLHQAEEEHSVLSMGHKVESGHVGCKVLPICNATLIGSNGSENGDSSEKDMNMGEKRKVLSRMKELLKWAAASKLHRGGNKGWKVLYSRNRGTLKAPNDDLSSTSGKLSFRCDVGSCSISSSVYSPLSLSSTSRNDQFLVKHISNPAISTLSSDCNGMDTLVGPISKECERLGKWITTDSDFVVLEL